MHRRRVINRKEIRYVRKDRINRCERKVKNLGPVLGVWLPSFSDGWLLSVRYMIDMILCMYVVCMYHICTYHILYDIIQFIIISPLFCEHVLTVTGSSIKFVLKTRDGSQSFLRSVSSFDNSTSTFYFRTGHVFRTLFRLPKGPSCVHVPILPHFLVPKSKDTPLDSWHTYLMVTTCMLVSSLPESRELRTSVHILC